MGRGILRAVLRAGARRAVFGLGVLIALLGPVSGAHFNPAVTLVNPAVTLAAWFDGEGSSFREAAAYVPAQIAGAIGGAVLADALFGRPLVELSAHDRSAGHLWLAEPWPRRAWSG